MKSSVLGEKYKNNIFVGDYNIGKLYYFEVNSTRTGIKLNLSQQQTGLSGLVVDNSNQLSAVTFGTGFGGITDIETEPTDGFLYFLSINDGNIYKIAPSIERGATREANSLKFNPCLFENTAKSRIDLYRVVSILVQSWNCCR